MISSEKNHWFWGAVKQQRGIISLILIASLFANLFAFSVSLFSMVVYDRILPNQAVNSLISLLVGLVFILALDYLARQIRSEFMEYAGKKIELSVNSQLFDKLVLESGYSNPRSSAASVALVREFDVIKEFMAAATVTALVDIPFALLFLFVIFIISDWIVVIPLGTISILLLVGFYTNLVMRSKSKNISKINQNKQAILYESLNARDSIICFGRGDFFSNKWKNAINEQSDISSSSKSEGNRASNIVNLMTQTNQILIVSAGVLNASFTGALIATTLLAGRAIAPFSAVVNLLARLSQAKQAYVSITKALAETEKPLSEGRLRASSPIGDIQLADVSIKYPNAKIPALENLNIKFSTGDRVAILGKTGSGKSTLLRVILGLIAPSDGAVKINGINLADYERESLMTHFSVLHQETHIFVGSVLENITLSTDYVNSEAVATACEVSGFIEVLKALPDGLNTVIGDGARGLSGGQKRLLTIARMVYFSRPIIIMDEPTGSLDPVSEELVIQRLQSSLQSCSIALFVTHRPGPIRMANKILVMNNGRIVDFSDKDTILKKLKNKEIKI